MTSSSRRYLSSSPFPPPVEVDNPTYVVGERVCHDEFGLGRILSLEGTTAVSVDFGSATRRVTLPTPRLFAL